MKHLLGCQCNLFEVIDNEINKMNVNMIIPNLVVLSKKLLSHAEQWDSIYNLKIPQELISNFKCEQDNNFVDAYKYAKTLERFLKLIKKVDK